MHVIIDIITAVVILYLMKSNYDCLPYCFGGSLVFVPLCATLMLVSIHIKKYRNEISIMMILCLILLGFNKTAYMELYKTHEASKIFYIIYILTFLTTAWTIVMGRIAFRKQKSRLGSSETHQTHVIKRIVGRIYLIMIISMTAVCITGISYNYDHGASYYDHIYAVMPLSLAAVMILIVMSVITMVILACIPEKYYLYALAGLERRKVRNIKQYFFLCMTILFVVGCGMEIMRGNWVLWTATMILLVSTILALWRIWKYILDTNPEEIISLMKPEKMNDLAFTIKYLLVSPLMVSCYGILIAIIT